MPTFTTLKPLLFLLWPEHSLLLNHILNPLAPLMVWVLSRSIRKLLLLNFPKVIHKLLIIDHEHSMRDAGDILRANLFLSAVVNIQFHIMLWKFHSIGCPVHLYLLIRWQYHIFVWLRLNFILYYWSDGFPVEVLVSAAVHPWIGLNIWWVHLLYFQGALIWLIGNSNMCNFLTDYVHICIFRNWRAFP